MKLQELIGKSTNRNIIRKSTGLTINLSTDLKQNKITLEDAVADDWQYVDDIISIIPTPLNLKNDDLNLQRAGFIDFNLMNNVFRLLYNGYTIVWKHGVYGENKFFMNPQRNSIFCIESKIYDGGPGFTRRHPINKNEWIHPTNDSLDLFYHCLPWGSGEWYYDLNTKGNYGQN
jgi:hypothetical protein